MIRAELKIKCWTCGQEEEVTRLLEDGAVDFNLDKVCPTCRNGWMVKKELALKKA